MMSREARALVSAFCQVDGAVGDTARLVGFADEAAMPVSQPQEHALCSAPSAVQSRAVQVR